MRNIRQRKLRKKQDDTSSKARVKENLKRKLLTSHSYKKLFVRKDKMKNVSDILANESRLCSAQGSDESFHQSGTDYKIESGCDELTEKDDQVLFCVNKLRDFWNKGQNAVVFDGQGRLVKVVHFVSSLLDNMKNPVLIISSYSALSLWENEFLKWPKSMNLVTHKGNKVKRAAIRDTKLYSENGCIKFQVLLTSLDAIVEVMEMLDHIKWGLLVIDEGQRSIYSAHITKLKMLMADMKLVTVSGESGDICNAYRNILSLFDCEYKITPTVTYLEMHDKISILKERLSPFIAFDCKFSIPDFEEYWVPVHLSSMQTEQYCKILASNIGALSSSIRSSSSLNDIIIQIQKCCDHPYLVDPGYYYSLTEASLTDPLDVDISLSGKMQLLDKLLLEIKRYGLRALVLLQSEVNSDKISTASILDHYVNKRFGENSYVYIPTTSKISTKAVRAKKSKSLEMFNHAESERFICLFDYHACHSSITLSRVDVVIIFNSNQKPLNDVKSLKRMTINSPCERLNVFRLYSAFTVEEKALILTKQATKYKPVSSKVYHQLLSWGASYLFSKVQNYPDSGPLSFIDDLVHELISLLKNTIVETSPTNRSVISKANMQNGAYSGSILLFGESGSHAKESHSFDDSLIDKNPTVFWRNLVKQSQYRPEKRCSRLEDEIRNDATTSSVAVSRPRSKRKSREKDGRQWGGTTSPFGSQQSCENVTEECTQRDSLSFNVTDVQLPILASTTTIGGQQGQSDQAPHTYSSSPLEREMERVQKEREKISILHQEQKSMIVSECEKEIAETKKKYDALIHDSEMSMTREIKILEDYQKLVDVHKLLAEILSQDSQDGFELDLSEINLNPSELDLHRPERRWRRQNKETCSFNIPDIPASALVRPKIPCSTTYMSASSSVWSGLRAPAPHLRSNPLPTLPTPALHLRPTNSAQLLLEPPPILSTIQTLPGLQPEPNNGL